MQTLGNIPIIDLTKKELKMHKSTAVDGQLPLQSSKQLIIIYKIITSVQTFDSADHRIIMKRKKKDTYLPSFCLYGLGSSFGALFCEFSPIETTQGSIFIPLLDPDYRAPLERFLKSTFYSI